MASNQPPQQPPHPGAPMQQQQQPQQPNMMMYAGQEQMQQQPQQNPNDVQQQQAYAQAQQQQGAYPQAGGQMAFQMPFFGGQMAPGAVYPAAQGMDYSAMMGYPMQQQQQADPNNPQAQQQQADYMNANQMLLARLQQQSGQPGAPPMPWMQMGYIPQGMEGFAVAGADGAMFAPWSATSAGLLTKIGGPEPTAGGSKKKNVRKKHKDKPKRPLSAYNLFFKDERKKILEGIPSKNDDYADENDNDDDDKKRKKTPHGKIGFENLAKIIGQRWQKLEPDRIEHYKKLAAVDMKRYKEQMELFLVKIEDEKKKNEDENGPIPAPAAAEEPAAEEAEGDAGGGDEDEGTEEPAAKKQKTENAGEEEEEAKAEKDEE